MSDVLPEEARRLLEGPLESYETLRILMLMREQSGRSWSEDTLRAALQGVEGVQEALRALQVSGLVRATAATAATSGSHYIYAPGTPAQEAAVATLARVYRERPTVVIKFISANAVRRVRKSALRAFADAVIRRQK